MVMTLVGTPDRNNRPAANFNWPINYDLFINFDTVPTVWVDDILEIDPEYLRMKGLA